MTREFIPVKIHIKEQPGIFERFKALWTPTQLILDSEGTERFRIEGFLPVDDFLAQLEMGLARVDFEAKRYADAERRFHRICEEHPRSGSAAEACYWAGVSAYKADNDSSHLKETAKLLHERFPDSEWARRSVVWSPGQQERAA